MTKIATGAIALEDGTIFWGQGHGAKRIQSLEDNLQSSFGINKPDSRVHACHSLGDIQ